MLSPLRSKRKFKRHFEGPVSTLLDEQEVAVVDRAKKLTARAVNDSLRDPSHNPTYPRLCPDDMAVMLVFVEGAELVYRCPKCKRIERSCQMKGEVNG